MAIYRQLYGHKLKRARPHVIRKLLLGSMYDMQNGAFKAQLPIIVPTSSYGLVGEIWKLHRAPAREIGEIGSTRNHEY